jgi:hypothetical protein
MRTAEIHPVTFLRKTASLAVFFLLLFLVPPFSPGAEKKSEKGSLAPKPVFRDPIHDGAADPTLIWNRARHEWWMFYTNRRADQASSDPKDVSWVHGTHIGIAVSKDGGATWSYRGEAKIPYGKADYTQWAPDIVYWKSQYHMFLVIVPGTFQDWNAPREIIHLSSKDLKRWTYISKVEVGSDRIIDPSLYPLPTGGWRMWYKDERNHSYIHYADSQDLVDWKGMGTAISDRHSEGPKIFRWKDHYWMITDTWKGLGVYHSEDLVHWTAQAENILAEPGHVPTDRTFGHHCDVVVNGERAFIYYFTHQRDADLDPKLPHSEERSVLQVGELQYKDGQLTVDRDQPVYVDLGGK